MMMFAIYGKDGWEDQRVEFKDWAKIKPTLPLKYVPLLTLADGRQVHGADAMTRWAGKKAGLYPSEADEAIFVDEMISTVFECLSKGPRVSHLLPAEKLAEEGKSFREGLCKVYFDYIEKRIDGPFFCGNDLTAADLTLFMLVAMFAQGEVSYIP